MWLYSVNRHSWLHTAVLVAAFTYWYSNHSKHIRRQHQTAEQSVAEAWTSIIHIPPASFRRIVVGFNSNVDLIVSGSAVLSNLNVTSTTPVDHHQIGDLEELSQSFAYQFMHGWPSERFMADRKSFETLVKEVERLPHAVTIGGNAALMAKRLAEKVLGKMEVILVGPIGPRAKQLLHPNILIQNSARIAKDELHIIMEYKQGQIYGDHVAPGSSRFIASHDMFSGSSVVVDMFFNTIATQQPDLVILSGLHLLQHQAEEMFQEKLRMIRRSLGQVSTHVPIHLQLGSLSNKDYSISIMNKIIPSVDSLGMNEQELLFLSQLGEGPYFDDLGITTQMTYHVHKVVDMIDWVLNKFGHEKGSNDGRRLARIHLQSMTYHIIATRGEDWSNAASAAAAGAQEAGRQACGAGGGHERVDTDLVDLRIPTTGSLLLDKESGRLYKFDPNSPLASWMRNDIVFVFTPLLVCKYPSRTVGVPDAIAAQSLAYSQFFRYSSGSKKQPILQQQQQQKEQEL